jgi:predicted TIM-barrel fold metal-dependent hydrolase
MKADGIVGIRLQLTRRKELPDLTSEEYRLLFRRLADLDLHVQAVVEGPLWPQVLPALENAGVKTVIDHFGHPAPQDGVNCPGFQAVLRSIDTGRTWVKLSAGYRLTWSEPGQSRRDPRSSVLARELAHSLLANAGPERLVWGSDCPFVGYERAVSFSETLADLLDWAPDAHTRRKMSDTALKLYFG